MSIKHRLIKKAANDNEAIVDELMAMGPETCANVILWDIGAEDDRFRYIGLEHYYMDEDDEDSYDWGLRDIETGESVIEDICDLDSGFRELMEVIVPYIEKHPDGTRRFLNELDSYKIAQDRILRAFGVN